jgi:hypothetical protein
MGLVPLFVLLVGAVVVLILMVRHDFGGSDNA